MDMSFFEKTIYTVVMSKSQVLLGEVVKAYVCHADGTV